MSTYNTPIMAYTIKEFDGHALRVDTKEGRYPSGQCRACHPPTKDDYIHTLFVDGREADHPYGLSYNPQFCGEWRRVDWPFIKPRTTVTHVRHFVADMVRLNLMSMKVT